MSNPRPLEQREVELIALLSHTQLGISPRTFVSKWDVNYEQLAAICHCTIGTVTRWFSRGDNYRRPGAYLPQTQTGRFAPGKLSRHSRSMV